MRGILHTSIVTEAEQIADGWKVLTDRPPVSGTRKYKLLFADGSVTKHTYQTHVFRDGHRCKGNLRIIAYREEPKP